MCLVGAGVTAGVMWARRPAEAGDRPGSGEEGADEEGTVVKTFHPRRVPLFVREIKRPAKVEFFFKADLMAQVAGPVKFIKKDVGDPVAKGEVLVQIDVPELVQEVAQKDALIRQAEAEAEVAQKKVTVAEKAARVSAKQVAAKEAEVEYLQLKLSRYSYLAKENVVYKDVVDEKTKELKVAGVGVQVAEADHEEVQAKLLAAQSDLKVKEAQVAVTKRDRDRTQALLDYATIRAPFNGVIISRSVDPGTFVHNATSGMSEPLLTLASTKKVTVTVPVPDDVAPFVSTDTDVVIEVGDQKIAGKVTRRAPYLDAKKGLTMNVEVDVYTPPGGVDKEYLANQIATYLAPIGQFKPASISALVRGGRTFWSMWGESKGGGPIVVPVMKGRRNPKRVNRLIPGAYCEMRLILEHFRDVALVPSGAVFNRGEKAYLFEVKDGKARLRPVRVQLDDGVWAKVLVIDREGDPINGQDEVSHDLTGKEEIIRSGQGEIMDGQEVKTALAKE
jgi:multidrug efflux pump subunit AcrA (membrane-fusion protein)